MNKPRVLRADEIDVKIKQVKENGVVCLLYKTARVDYDILDETFDEWCCEYKEIKGNLYCGIKVGNVWRWNCGIESRKDSEGNEKKGEASDALKRAGTAFGIGRELYSAPFIWIHLINARLKTANATINSLLKKSLLTRRRARSQGYQSETQRRRNVRLCGKHEDGS